MDSVSNRMRSNRLQLNEVMWCASARRQSKLPRWPITVAGASVEPVSVVRDLGVYFDSDLGVLAPPPMYVGPRTVSRCFAALRQLRHLCRHVTIQQLHALWWSRSSTLV